MIVGVVCARSTRGCLSCADEQEMETFFGTVVLKNWVRVALTQAQSRGENEAPSLDLPSLNPLGEMLG